MERTSIRERFKQAPLLKKWVDWLIMNPTETRPRWFIRLMAPFYQHRGRGSVIHRSVRMDTPPYRRFSLGRKSVIESFSCINNAVGDVIIGDHTRVGLHNTIIGPVTIGSHVNLAQGITVTALNHNFSDSTLRIDEQGVSTTPVVIGDDAERTTLQLNDLMGIGSDFAPSLKGLNEFKTKFSKEVTPVAPDRDVPVRKTTYALLHKVKDVRTRK